MISVRIYTWFHKAFFIIDDYLHWYLVSQFFNLNLNVSFNTHINHNVSYEYQITGWVQYIA